MQSKTFNTAFIAKDNYAEQKARIFLKEHVIIVDLVNYFA